MARAARLRKWSARAERGRFHGSWRQFLKLNLVTLAVAVVFMPFVAVYFWGPPWTALRIAGLAIGIPCFLLLALARVQLGRAFSVQAKASTLVTSGLYSRIRNPIYLFGVLAIAGFLLWVNQPRLLLCFIVLIPMQVWRSRVEARALEDKFGAQYLEYKKRTWF